MSSIAKCASSACGRSSAIRIRSATASASTNLRLLQLRKDDFDMLVATSVGIMISSRVPPCALGNMSKVTSTPAPRSASPSPPTSVATVASPQAMARLLRPNVVE